MIEHHNLHYVEQGCSHWGWGYRTSKYMACLHTFPILIVLVNVVLLVILKESPIYWEIGLERSLFDSKLRLRSLTKILFSLAPLDKETFSHRSNKFHCFAF